MCIGHAERWVLISIQLLAGKESWLHALLERQAEPTTLFMTSLNANRCTQWPI